MKLLYALAVNQAEFLTGREKLLLAEMVDSDAFLTSLSIDNLSQIVGRIVNTSQWDPAYYLERAHRDLHYIDRSGVHTVLVNDSRYPAQLRAIHDPPFLLMARGALPRWDVPAVAIVGTRNPTAAAVAATLRLAHECAAAGIPVVSGLARGIDAAAHQGTLRGAGVTMAVLGSGIDVIYPRSHKPLAERILDRGGVILSEYPPGSAPTRYRFPERNRIISGLCRSVVIAQAPARSGALITGDYALEQGRDVYVLHEGLEGETGAGGRNYERDGSAVVVTVGDIIADWIGASPVAAADASRVRSGTGNAPGGPGAVPIGRQLALQLEEELQLQRSRSQEQAWIGWEPRDGATEIREARMH